MRKTLILAFILILVNIVQVNATELGNMNLQGVGYFTTVVRFNGVPFGEIYVDEDEEKFEEYNLKEVEERLKEDGIPFKKEDIRRMYRLLEVGLKDSGVQVLKMKKYTGEKRASTVIPVLTAHIDTKLVVNSHEYYFSVVQLTVSKWISNWVGTKRVVAPVYVWSTRKLVVGGPDDVVSTMAETVSEVMKTFRDDLKLANREPEPGEEKEKEKDAKIVDKKIDKKKK